jgi:hypothetical protein
MNSPGGFAQINFQELVLQHQEKEYLEGTQITFYKVNLKVM